MTNISCRREREPKAVHPLQNLAMNVSESKAESFDPTCPMNEILWEQEYQELVPLIMKERNIHVT